MDRPSLLTLLLVAVVAAIAGCGDDDSAVVDTGTSDGAEGGASFAQLEIRYERSDDADVSYDYRIECGTDSAVMVVNAHAEMADIDADAACDALRQPAVVERLVDGPDDEVCTEIYGGPGTAAISGSIDDDAVDTSVDRTNGCGIDDWQLLGDLLPPPVEPPVEPEPAPATEPGE